MNTNTKRMVLAAIAAFYVVLGGLWASNHFPLQKFMAQSDVQSELDSKLGPDAYKSDAYQESQAYQMHYAMTKLGLDVVLGRIALYETLLIWGTIALAVGGGVMFITRGRKAGAL